MVLKFQLKSWNNVKKLLLANLPLEIREIRKLEEIIAKRDVEKMNRFIDRVCANYRLNPDFQNSLKEKVNDEVEYLKSIKGFGAYENLSKKMFVIRRNMNFNGKRVLSTKAYKLFMNFLVAVEALDSEKEINVADIKKILAGSGKLNPQSLEKYKNFTLEMEGKNVYAYSGDKRIIDIVNVLSALQDKGIITKLEKLIYINRSLDKDIERYINQRINKMYIPLSDKEELDFILDDVKVVYRAIAIYHAYNTLCNVCYEAATSFAVIVVV